MPPPPSSECYSFLILMFIINLTILWNKNGHNLRSRRSKEFQGRGLRRMSDKEEIHKKGLKGYGEDIRGAGPRSPWSRRSTEMKSNEEVKAGLDFSVFIIYYTRLHLHYIYNCDGRFWLKHVGYTSFGNQQITLWPQWPIDIQYGYLNFERIIT